MRRRESFVQIQMDYIDAHVTGSRDADQCIHVCAVHINQPTGIMNDAANPLNVLFKQSERVWVC